MADVPAPHRRDGRVSMPTRYKPSCVNVRKTYECLIQATEASVQRDGRVDRRVDRRMGRIVAIDHVMRPRGQSDRGSDHRPVDAIVRCSGLNVTLTITRSWILALPVGLVFRFVSRGGCFPSR